MLKSKIGAMLRSSKYRREYVQQKLGVSANTLSNWSRGNTYPTVDKAFILAELLDCKVEDLYEYIKEEEE
jgi:putative transcriptional regulator